MGPSLKIFFFGAILIFIYCEYITYWILPYTWIQQPNCPTKYCKKVLLVADPQIVGPEWEGFFFLDWIAIFDSDRYIKRTFVKALNYLQPDYIIFLGDIMDQGYLASNPEFEIYFKRIQKIFEIPTSLKNTKVIYAAGDNDIGGEFFTPLSVGRFEKKFNHTTHSLLTDIMEFCVINVMTSSMQPSNFLKENIIRVALSHIPIIPEDIYTLDQVVEKIKPHVIFSGHDHTSSHYVAHEKNVYEYEKKSILPQSRNNTFLEFRKGLIHEITVPTCSYRMGVPEMGYGAAFLDVKNKSMYYNVLWLPHRFLQIYFYLLTIVCILLYTVLKINKRNLRCKLFNLSRESKSTKNFSSSWY